MLIEPTGALCTLAQDSFCPTTRSAAIMAVVNRFFWLVEEFAKRCAGDYENAEIDVLANLSRCVLRYDAALHGEFDFYVVGALGRLEVERRPA